MMSFSDFLRNRVLLVDFLAIIFGISSWISINGLWVELPVLVNQLPEGWSLPSYLSTIVQLANIGPISYSIFRALAPRSQTPQNIIILVLLVLGTGASLGLALGWKITSEIAGKERSTMLFVFVFLLSLVDCTSSVLFLPYMGLFRDVYLNSYLVGEGLSGFIPSIAALAQGVGGNPVCKNVTKDDGTISFQPVSEEPRFTAQDFFLFLMGMMILSLSAFVCLEWLPVTRREKVFGALMGERRESKDSSESDSQSSRKNIQVDKEEEAGGHHNSGGILDTSDSQLVIPESDAEQGVPLLLFMVGAVCFLANGALPSIQSYSCLPYGNTVYHLVATLNAMANPLMAFFSMFVACRSKRMVCLLTGLSFLTTGFILATALTSPEPMWGELGGGLTVVAWVVVGALFSYVKVAIAGLCRDAGALFKCGVATQIGSACGALTAFLLVNQTTLFQGFYVTCES